MSQCHSAANRLIAFSALGQRSSDACLYLISLQLNSIRRHLAPLSTLSRDTQQRHRVVLFLYFGSLTVTYRLFFSPYPISTHSLSVLASGLIEGDWFTLNKTLNEQRSSGYSSSAQKSTCSEGNEDRWGGSWLNY